jgi:hypothetical protein
VFHQTWKLIGKEDIGDLMPVLTRQNVRVVYGVAICQSKLSSINGIPVKNVIDLSLFVMVQNLARYTDLVGLGWYRAEKGWYGRMVWEEEDWVDEQDTAHRPMDE